MPAVGPGPGCGSGAGGVGVVVPGPNGGGNSNGGGTAESVVVSGGLTGGVRDVVVGVALTVGGCTLVRGTQV